MRHTTIVWVFLGAALIPGCDQPHRPPVLNQRTLATLNIVGECAIHYAERAEPGPLGPWSTSPGDYPQSLLCPEHGGVEQ